MAPESKTDTPMTQADFLTAMKMLLGELKGGSAEPADKARLALEGERLLLEHERLKREMPENKQAPGLSVYSYPDGDLAHPKAPLKTRVYWSGYELTTETMTPYEVDLINKLEPMDTLVTKTDGTRIPFRVAVKRTDAGQLEQMSVWFPTKGEHKHNHHSMTSYIQQALGERIPSADELMVELARLRAELETARVGVTGVV